jgi:hypothetical protein
MASFYKLALKASLIMTPSAPLGRAELLSLMFRNSPEVRDRVLNAGIPDTMRAAFWTILCGAEVKAHSATTCTFPRNSVDLSDVFNWLF